MARPAVNRASPYHDAGPTGSMGIERRRLGAAAPRNDRPDVGLHGRGSAAPADAKLRSNGGTLRSRARLQRRRRRRAAPRRRADPSVRLQRFDHLLVDRKPPGLPDHRPGDSLLPDALAAARSHAVAACGSNSGGTAPLCASAGHCVLSRRRGRGTRRCRLGRDESGRLLRGVCVCAGHQRARRVRGRVPLPLQSQRQRAPPHPHGALHRRPGHPRVCRPRRHPDCCRAVQHGGPRISRRDEGHSRWSGAAAGVRPRLRCRRRARARPAGRATAQPPVRARQPNP